MTDGDKDTYRIMIGSVFRVQVNGLVLSGQVVHGVD